MFTRKEPIPPERSVLFVCMGNICRSPTAEGVFRHAAERAGIARWLFIDSAGIGDWHANEPPDKRAIAAAHKRGYDLRHLRARKVTAQDFARFDWIFAMDADNLRELEQVKPADYRGTMGLFLDLAPHLGAREVPDPYFGGPAGFEHVLDLVEQASEALVDAIRHRVQFPAVEP